MKEYIKLFEAEKRPDKLSLVSLPYRTDELEPVMSQATVEYHYGKLSRGYVDRYNAGEGDPDFNYGGAMLHNLFWPQLRPPGGANKPTGLILDKINKEFGDYENFKEKFIEAAMALQGSGWCYLSRAGDIRTLANQNYNKSIVLAVDLWEHSWTVGENKPDKARYVKNIWRIINWDVVNQRLS
jgi:Fe-Mn family superoxide dismutase